MVHDHALRDTKRDAAALFRAILNRDHEGAGVIADNPRCPSCLAIQAAVLGLVLKVEYADSVHLDDDGCVAFTGDERDDLDAQLAGVLTQLGDDDGEQR